MFEVIVREKFCAAHQIEGYRGKCSELHGHNWIMEIRFQINKLDGLGMSLDFANAKELLREVVGSLDHSFLNKNPLLAGENPTAERLVIVIYNLVSAKTPADIKIASVTIWESDNSAVTYFPEK